MNLTDLRIENRPIDALTPYANNPRTHSARQIRQIAESLKRFGWTNPVLIDAEDRIMAGHGRVAAARKLAMSEVPTIRLDHLNEAERRAYILADNKLAENAGWDEELLAIELQFLVDTDLGFEVEITGFETAEIDRLLSFEEVDDAPEEVALPGSDAAPVSRPGDLWQIGPHRLLCGDALERANWDRLVNGERAQMAFTDPPYNVPIRGHVSGLGKTQHRAFAMGCGEMDATAFTGFLTTVFEHLVAVSHEGAIHYHCMDWRHMGEML
ncbi:MAG: ParB/Srx family N-terminal domain-containing protein, partial [Pseudomonadota bacterium]